MTPKKIWYVGSYGCNSKNWLVHLKIFMIRMPCCESQLQKNMSSSNRSDASLLKRHVTQTCSIYRSLSWLHLSVFHVQILGQLGTSTSPASKDGKLSISNIGWAKMRRRNMIWSTNFESSLPVSWFTQKWQLCKNFPDSTWITTWFTQLRCTSPPTRPRPVGRQVFPCWRSKDCGHKILG